MFACPLGWCRGKLTGVLLIAANCGAPFTPGTATAWDIGGIDGAWFTDVGMVCGYVFCMLATVLACTAPVFDFAMSARALRIADVSAAGAPLALPAFFADAS